MTTIQTITKTEWIGLIEKCRETFPESSITMSAIVPPKEDQNLGKKVDISNKALHKACQQLNGNYLPIVTSS